MIVSKLTLKIYEVVGLRDMVNVESQDTLDIPTSRVYKVYANIDDIVYSIKNRNMVEIKLIL